MTVGDDVQPDEFFEVHLKTKAPAQSGHYKALFQLTDLAGNAFGDQVELDFIVEDEKNESVLLKEMMDYSNESFSQDTSFFTGILQKNDPSNASMNNQVPSAPQPVSKTEKRLAVPLDWALDEAELSPR